MVDSACHSTEVDQVSTRNSWEYSGEKSPRCSPSTSRQWKLSHKKESQSFLLFANFSQYFDFYTSECLTKTLEKSLKDKMIF